MLKKFICSSLLASALVAPTFADTVIVNENFDSYADDAAFLAVWGATTGLGTAAALPADTSSGVLVPGLFGSGPAGLQGKGVDHLGASASTPGMVNQYGGVIDQTSAQNPDFTINPSATENVVLKADIYFSNSGNERMTVGLRSITALPDGADADTFPDANTANILEMGQWNALPTSVPPVPGAPTTVTGFAYRLINFGTVTSPINVQPNWQYFTLAPELDRATDTDTVTNLSDIGAGWHTYEAVISPTSITLSLDLFRDGKTNLTRDGAGVIEIGVGADGVDASITYEIATLAAGFNALRFGGASGLASGGTGEVVFDNIYLALEDSIIEPPADDADFDNDGDVDGRDFLIWQRGYDTPDALNQDGDADFDTDVDGDDLAIWQGQYGEPVPPLTAGVAAVPEPSTGILLLAACSSLLVCKRR